MSLWLGFGPSVANPNNSLASAESHDHGDCATHLNFENEQETMESLKQALTVPVRKYEIGGAFVSQVRCEAELGRGSIT